MNPPNLAVTDLSGNYVASVYSQDHACRRCGQYIGTAIRVVLRGQTVYWCRECAAALRGTK